MNVVDVTQYVKSDFPRSRDFPRMKELSHEEGTFLVLRSNFIRHALEDFFMLHARMVEAFNDIEGHEAKSGISSHPSIL